MPRSGSAKDGNVAVDNRDVQNRGTTAKIQTKNPLGRAPQMTRVKSWSAFLIAAPMGFGALLPSTSAIAADEQVGLCGQVVEQVEANPELKSQMDELIAQGADAGAVTRALLQAGFPLSAVVNQVIAAFGAADRELVESVVEAAVFETQQFGVSFIRAGAACAGADIAAVNQAIRTGLANMSGVSQTAGEPASPN
jgi:hypothetical protein